MPLAAAASQTRQEPTSPSVRAAPARLLSLDTYRGFMQVWPPWISKMLRVQFGSEVFSGTYAPVWEKCAVLLVMWLFCWWRYRRKLFFKI